MSKSCKLVEIRYSYEKTNLMQSKLIWMIAGGKDNVITKDKTGYW